MKCVVVQLNYFQIVTLPTQKCEFIHNEPVLQKLFFGKQTKKRLSISKTKINMLRISSLDQVWCIYLNTNLTVPAVFEIFMKNLTIQSTKPLII